MKHSGRCPKCGCADIIADAKAIDRCGHGQIQEEISIAIFRRPEALIFKDKRETTVSAWVCGGCGFVELYADHPATIRRPKPL